MLITSRSRLSAAFLCIFISSQIQAADTVELALTYPNGSSPKVFTTGWSFGARATLNKGTKDQKDLSKQVAWSGTGSFSPAKGAFSKPSFAAPGANTIVLSVKMGKETVSKKFSVQAVSPARYATVGDFAVCRGDAHGCPACPHPVTGKLTQGNPKVLINGKAVICVGSRGKHLACCGPNTFTVVDGDYNVLVDGKRVAMIGDKTQHCGGIGQIGKSPLSTAGTYTGSFAGSAAGQASFSITPDKVSGTFKGNHTKEGGGVANLTLKGSLRGTAVSGTTSGTATYIGLNNKVAKATVTGTFQGTISGSLFKGNWKGVAKGISSRKVSGTFTTRLVR